MSSPEHNATSQQQAAKDGQAHPQSLQTWRMPGLYAGMRIAGVTGITEAQRHALRALGAVA